MVQGYNGKNTLRKRRNPFWLSARGVNLGASSQRPENSVWENDDETPK